MKQDIKRYFANSYSWALATVVALSSTGCQDDLLYDGENGPEGEPAVLTLTVGLPEREQYTRSALTDADDNRVNSLWIGIYNKGTKECKTNQYINSKNGAQFGFTGNNGTHAAMTLTIPTVSGDSYIVAVANPEGHKGIRPGDENESNLLDLLDNATTWDEYQKISVSLAESAGGGNFANVQTPEVSESYALVMSGSFVPNDYNDHDKNQTWTNELLNQTVYIAPGATKIDGRVHLRRLMSHITFNISATGDVVNIEPVSYQVHNAPMYSWVHERTNETDFSTVEASNAGDALQPTYGENQNYKSSLLFTSTEFTKGGTDANNPEYSFDFWMMENKRQGLESCDAYSERELEYGGTIGNLTDPYPENTTANYGTSGVFVSLTGSNPVTLNNKAAYVDIPCVVTYKVKQNSYDETGTPGTGTPDATRTATVTYRIHLGYTNDETDEAKKSRNFNSYRNSSYTYNVKVQSVKNVIVEAFRQGDNQPGGFGEVTDVTERMYDLDAHYGVFNINLSAEDLEHFSFKITAWENGVSTDIFGGMGDKDNIPLPGYPNYKYYSWIELLPTTGQNVLASYPSDKTTLKHLGDLLKEKNPTPGYYTVFVNEYVYENSADESSSSTPNWHGYVNQPNRNVWLNVAEATSADGASSYYKAKYAISQKSIQTYYDQTDPTALTALGLENTDENFGMNIRWTNINNWTVGTTGNTLDNENGRFNAWQFATNDNYGAKSSWENAVSFKTPQNINEITNEYQNLSNYPNISTDARTWPVPQVVLLGSLSGTANYNKPGDAVYDPQSDADAQSYQGFYACMNRNRDLNGDGKISVDEIRWFLPTSGQMLRMILGRNSLKNPIMSYPNVNLPFPPRYGQDVLFHYLTSDFKIIWTEEGMSSSSFNQNDDYARAPWQVRCVRNLGTDLSTAIARGNRVETAYKAETASNFGGIVRPVKYYGSSLRNPSTTPLPIHKTNDPLNRVAMYGFEIAPRGNDFETTSTTEQYIGNYANYSQQNPTPTQYNAYSDAVSNNICSSLDQSTGRTGWRVPNQKEIVIMMRTKYNGNNILVESNADNSYYCVTQEYWSNEPTCAPSLTPGPQYRFCTVTGIQAEARFLGQMNLLRCVRDLTAAEANMTYSEIIGQTKNKRRK